jgi:hypothetical protein
LKYTRWCEGGSSNDGSVAGRPSSNVEAGSQESGTNDAIETLRLCVARGVRSSYRMGSLRAGNSVCRCEKSEVHLRAVV